MYGHHDAFNLRDSNQDLYDPGETRARVRASLRHCTRTAACPLSIAASASVARLLGTRLGAQAAACRGSVISKVPGRPRREGYFASLDALTSLYSDEVSCLGAHWCEIWHGGFYSQARYGRWPGPSGNTLSKHPINAWRFGILCANGRGSWAQCPLLSFWPLLLSQRLSHPTSY